MVEPGQPHLGAGPVVDGRRLGLHGEVLIERRVGEAACPGRVRARRRRRGAGWATQGAMTAIPSSPYLICQLPGHACWLPGSVSCSRTAALNLRAPRAVVKVSTVPGALGQGCFSATTRGCDSDRFGGTVGCVAGASLSENKGISLVRLALRAVRAEI